MAYCEQFFSPDKTPVDLCGSVVGINITSSINDCVMDIHVNIKSLFSHFVPLVHTLKRNSIRPVIRLHCQYKGFCLCVS